MPTSKGREGRGEEVRGGEKREGGTGGEERGKDGREGRKGKRTPERSRSSKFATTPLVVNV